MWLSVHSVTGVAQPPRSMLNDLDQGLLQHDSWHALHCLPALLGFAAVAGWGQLLQVQAATMLQRLRDMVRLPSRGGAPLDHSALAADPASWHQHCFCQDGGKGRLIAAPWP